MRPRDCGGRFRRAEAGFTMVEALVAMTVLTLLAAVLLRGVVALRADASELSGRTSRAILARTLLDDALRNRKLRDGSYAGMRDGWPWRLVATRVDLVDQIGGPPRVAAGVAPTWRLQRLAVTVGQGTAPLETLRIAVP